MPGLTLYTSNRMEILVKLLADVLKVPLNHPLASEIILVQSKGMERWLSMELSQRNGICANVRFPYPIHFVHNLFQEILPDVPDHSPYEPMIMSWDVMRVLPSMLDNPEFQAIKTYFGGADIDLKLFQLSVRIADLFDQYLLFRPDMILNWDRGIEDQWQAILWRKLVKEKGKVHRAALHDSFLRAMRDSHKEFRTVPERISIFGISALPPFYIQILAAVSSVINVNLFLMNPCREFWGDIVSDREMNRYVSGQKGGDVLPGELYLEVGNRLLASMGALGREFFHMIGEIQCEEATAFEDPGENTLLAAIQSDILNLRERKSTGALPFPEADDSLQVHSCHSPLREIEVLQDSLLAIFANHPDIRPDDVLVMIPDIELYAPFIQAIFSIPPDDSRCLPFTIADRGLLNESGLIDTFLKLLDLAGSRYEVSGVLDLLEADTVRTKFSLTEEDLALIHHWIRETGIRWGIDAQNKETLGLPAYSSNTWRAGLDRMLLGYAMPAGSEDTLFMGILPFNGIEGGSTEILGHFLQFTETFFRFMAALEEKKTLNEWGDFLIEILEAFFSDDENQLRDIQAIRRVIHNLPDIQASCGFAEKIGLDVIKAWLKQNLKESGFGAGFLTGGVTFCTILPMRSIPFKVICLIGMNDASYPRQSRKLGFDLMAASPRIGDRSRRMDDRHLFLEAILSARQKLHISYVGRSMKDNSNRPPSVLVSELLDYIEEGFGETVREGIVSQHRLQAFSPAYFAGIGKLFSYSAENLRAAQSAVSGRKVTAPFIPTGLSEPEEECKMIKLESLGYFFSNPARFLLRHRLGIHLLEEPAIMDESEPFELNKLEQYLMRQELVARALEEKPLRDVYPLMQASGRLPHGSPGLCCYDDLCTSTTNFITKIHPHIEGGQREPIAVDIAVDGFHLTGRLVNVYPGGLVSYRLAKIKGRDRITAWISHLVLNHLREQAAVRETVIVGEDRAFRYSQVEDTETYLRILLDIYWKGLRIPLHFFPESSLAYAEQATKVTEPEKAMRTAKGKWEAFEYAENDNPYYRLCFRQIDPLDTEFRELAMTIFEPMLRHEEPIR
ncbi:MAG: exodeoxyribonuclease V subunit gamma [Deltaproteobacteria bacterium]|nr:exodeoxyribonuclease V subunit gamma [Deltaproteobacteria bacterium]